MMSTHRLVLLLTVTSVAVVATNECQGIKRDLIILLDSSSSVGQENFDKAKEFLVAIISELVIGVEGYQIGLVKFSDSVFPVAGLVQYKDKAGLIGAIRAIDYKGGGTNTARALWGAMKLFGRSGNRGAVPDQIITLTDGASDNAASTASEIEAARAKKIEMISIGVGSDINREELRSLATNESLMYVVDSYDDIDSIKTQLIASSCGGQSSTGNLTLTRMTTHAVLGQPFRFRCDTRGPRTGVLLFKLNMSPLCVVSRNSCRQFDPIDVNSYSCACVHHTGDPISFFLDIKELRNNNLGEWLCEYRNASNTITLEPTDPTGPDSPAISPSDSVVAVERHNLTLICTAECIPNCTFSWFKVKDKDNVGVKNNYTGSSSLVWTSVTPETEGNYTCVAVNPASEKTEMVSVEVKVHSAPRLDAASPFKGRVLTSVGREETLRVPLLSSPAPSLTWSRVQGGKLLPVRNGEEMDSNIEPSDGGRGYFATLHFTVEEGETGVYCLTASNYVGHSYIYIDLEQEDQRVKMTPFGLGLAVGSCWTLLVALLVAILGYLKHRQIRRALENPYASTKDRFHLQNTDQSAVESAYQELPTLNLDRNLGQETESEEDLGKSPIYDVMTKIEKDDPKRECCVSVVMGKSLDNPMYGHVNPGLDFREESQ